MFEELLKTLRSVVSLTGTVAARREEAFGTRHVIERLLKAPDGRQLNGRTAWFIDADGDVPRFITAHPFLKRRS
jgi:hypothetical protein